MGYGGKHSLYEIFTTLRILLTYNIQATQLAMLVVIAILMIYHRAANRKANAGTLVIEGLDGFRYTY
jgi:hypothetical protein